MKKVFGIISIILGILFTPVIAVLLLQLGERILKQINHTSIDTFDDLLDALFFLTIMGFLTCTFYIWGYKCIKGKKVKLLDEIIDTKSTDDT